MIGFALIWLIGIAVLSAAVLIDEEPRTETDRIAERELMRRQRR